MDNILSRDGVTQGQRKLKALNPDYIHVDERTLDDLLQFAQALSKEVKFFNTENKEDGSWKRIFSDSVQENPTLDKNWREKALEFIENPEKFGTDTSFSTPHRALFFTFLLLMDFIKQQTNQLTKRHLDFLYRESLRLVHKKAVPDQVNLIMELVDGVDQLLLKKGTKLLAGQDALGKDLIYETDKEIVLNKATIEQAKTIYVKHEVGIEGLNGPEAIERVFGNPNEGYALPELPESVKSLDMKKTRLERLKMALEKEEYTKEKATGYINDYLFMTVSEFLMVMKSVGITSKTAEYEILTRAWNQKREKYPHKTPLIVDEVFVVPEAREDIVESVYDQFKNFDEWNTFGTRDELSGTAQKGFMGMAMATPALKMKEGERSITLQLFVEDEGWKYIKEIENKRVDGDGVLLKNNFKDLFGISLSTAAGWEKVTEENILYAKTNTAADEKRLEIKLLLPESFPSVQTIEEEVVFSGIAKKDPALMVSINNISINYKIIKKSGIEEVETEGNDKEEQKFKRVKAYEVFRNVKIRKADLAIDVKGIADFSMENELGSIDPKKPFELLGNDPVVGSPFYLAHPEVCYKNISHLNLEMEWMEKPENLNDYYQCYFNDYEFTVAGEIATVKEVTKDSSYDITVRIKEGTLGKVLYVGEKPFEISIQEDIELSLNVGVKLNVEEACELKFINGTKYNLTCRNFSKEEIGVNERTQKLLKALLRKELVYNLKAIVSKNAKDNLADLETPLFGDIYGGSEAGCQIDVLPGILDYSEKVSDNELFNIGDRKCYYRFELADTDFYHKRYPFLLQYYSQKSLLSIKDGDIATIDNKEYMKLLEHPPYTPRVKKMTLGYSVSVSSEVMEDPLTVNQILHFGYKDVNLESAVKNDEVSGNPKMVQSFDYQGELLLGLKDLRPPQNLNILFQLSEGSTDADLGMPPVEWYYLENNEWKTLHNGNILRDGTHGLVNPGIIEFKMPAIVNEENTLLPNNLHWIKASVRSNTQAVCKTISIDTQAISATFADNDNSPEHYKKPLVPKSIKASVEDIPQLGSIKQLYTSFGQRPVEMDDVFYGRVSERLRHKNRAVSMWDYERILLQQFPDVHKAKCVVQKTGSVGSVKMIVIPDLKGKVPFNPFEPKFTQAKLEQMKRFMEKHAFSYVDISVCNPVYKQVEVTVEVEFKAGLDEGYYISQLNTELKKFLSPWAYDGGVDIVVGRKIHESILVDFIEELPYIDYIKKLVVKLTPENSGNVNELEPDVVIGSAIGHIINNIARPSYNDDSPEGIGNMFVGEGGSEIFRVF